MSSVQFSHSVVSDSLQPHELQSARLFCSWDFPGKNIGVTCHFLLQGIFSKQRSNLHLLFGRWIRYHWVNREPLIFYMTNIANEIPSFKVQFSSFAQSCPTLCTPWTAACQASLSIANSRVYSNSCPLKCWFHPTVSSSVIPFSTCPQSLPASESFPMSQLFAWGGQSTGASALASFLPKKSQGWSPSEWISLQSKGLSRVFSNTTVQKHQFFAAQLSSRSNSHIHTWPLEKP